MSLLKQLRINEVSLVSKAANSGAVVKISKSAPDYSHLRGGFIKALHKKSEYDEEMSSPGFSRDPARTDRPQDDDGASERRNVDRFQDRQEREQEGDIIATNVMPPRLHDMVSTIRTAAPSLSEQEIVHFLTMTARGRAVAEHLNNHITKSKDQPMTRNERLQTLAKRYGVETIAKGMITDNDAYDISEHEMTAMIAAEATRKGLSFEKYFTAPENVELRKAHQLTKGTLMRAVGVQPVTVETGRTNTDSDAQAAYEQLMRQAEALAAAGKYQSVASAFSALFSDQRNAELAARAHKRPNAAHA